MNLRPCPLKWDTSLSAVLIGMVGRANKLSDIPSIPERAHHHFLTWMDSKEMNQRILLSAFSEALLSCLCYWSGPVWCLFMISPILKNPSTSKHYLQA
jgi:hypothetical protein